MAADLPIELFERPEDWTAWLKENHETSAGVWLRLAKKGGGLRSVTYAEALEEALRYGWIDGQKKACDEASWLQKFTRRGQKSIWSKINVEKAEALIRAGRMEPPGMAEVERALADGRWAQAYDSQKSAAVPEDFQSELDRNPKAKAFFETLESYNRYAILFRIQTAKKAEIRAKNIQKFIGMLERGEKIHPKRS
jgi:uncharacterized protein YdeI (YjbR/CyaY-like superfamily)